MTKDQQDEKEFIEAWEQVKSILEKLTPKCANTIVLALFLNLKPKTKDITDDGCE